MAKIFAKHPDDAVLVAINPRDPATLAGRRSPIGRAGNLAKHRFGILSGIEPLDLAAILIKRVVATAKLKFSEIDDLLWGCAFPEWSQGMNFGRMAILLATEASEEGILVPGSTINQFCASGARSMDMGARQIMTGMSGIILCGGIEFMDNVAMGGNPVEATPLGKNGTYMNVGLAALGGYDSMVNTAQRVAEEHCVSRGDMDKFAAESHEKALVAIRAGKFKDEIVPITVPVLDQDGDETGETIVVNTDECPREPDLEKMAQLKPVSSPFKDGAEAVITAGNSSPMNDGACCFILMSRVEAEKHGLVPVAVFRGGATKGVHPRLMGIGPIPAVRKLFEQTGVTMKDISLVELNEAFASQSIAVVRELGIPEEILNVNGGAIALGHPLGASGAILTLRGVSEMMRRGEPGLLIVTMCIGGGHGYAALWEREEAA